MKSLVLLYKIEGDNDTIHIKEFPQILDKKDSYITEKSCWGEDSGVRKGELEKFILKTSYGSRYHKGVYLPYVSGWGDVVYYFVNKVKYDKEPVFYQEQLKNYKI